MWDITYNGMVMGAANIEKEGLYYIVFCECTLPDEGIYRIMISDGESERNLGICVPTGNRFTLCARVPSKNLREEKLAFTLVSKNAVKAYRVQTGQPFGPIDRLDDAHLEVRGDGAYVVIDPAPNPQDSDLNP